MFTTVKYGTGMASITHGEPGPMMPGFFDLIDERDGVVRSGDPGIAIDVGAGPQPAGISLTTVNEAGQLVEFLRDLLGHFQR